MAFTDEIGFLPFNPATENGRGFLPVILRAGGHFLYLLGRLSDTPTRRPTDNQIREEIDAIRLHINEFNIPDYLSEQAQTFAAAFVSSFNALDAEIAEWDGDTRINNLRSLANRTIQLVAFLDRETLGIRDSDAGQEL